MTGMVAAWACGAVTTPTSELHPEFAELCPAPVNLSAFAPAGLNRYEDAESWWGGVAAEAAALFHAEGVDASARRAFFHRYVYTETPVLVVELDAFVVSEALALALAREAVRQGDPTRAILWLGRSETSDDVNRCADGIRMDRP